MAMEDYDKQRWETIARDMLKHGSTEKWTKEAVQRKWSEMHPNGSPIMERLEYTSPGEYELVNRVSYHRPSYSFSTQSPVHNYQPQPVMPLHQRHHSYSGRESIYGEQHVQKLPPNHPLHAVQQVALGLPPLRSSTPELLNLALTNQSSLHPPLPNLAHRQQMHSPPAASLMQTASHQESSPTMHTRQRSASSNNIPTVATVTLDEVRSRAGSDASQQMAIHQQQAQMMFEQQKRREEDRIRALLEVGGSSQAPQQPPLPSQVIEYGQNRDEDHDMGLELLQQPQESQSNQPMDNQESQAEGRDNSGRAGSWHSN
jgi:hypothetical protein